MERDMSHPEHEDLPAELWQVVSNRSPESLERKTCSDRNFGRRLRSLLLGRKSSER